MNATTLITDALQLLGVLDPGETPSTSELNAALRYANNLLDNWQTERLNVVQITTLTQPLVAGTQTYTMGTGGDFNTPRPIRIEAANILMPSPNGLKLAFELELVDAHKWGKIRVRSAKGTIPTALYDSGGFPLRSLSFWPAPANTNLVEFLIWAALSSFADLTTDVSFAPGYSRAITYNLAIELAAIYATEPPPSVIQIAAESKAAIRALNIATPGELPPSGAVNAIPAQTK